MRSLKIGEFVFLPVTLITILTAVHFSRASARTSALLQQRDLSRVLKKHQSLELETEQAARQVRATGRLSLTTATRQFELHLVVHDLRAPGYRAEEVSDGGSTRSVEMGPVNTYRGAVEGMDDAEARFTVRDDRIEGVIVTPAQLYYFEPLRDFAADASPTEY